MKKQMLSGAAVLVASCIAAGQLATITKADKDSSLGASGDAELGLTSTLPPEAEPMGDGGVAAAGPDVTVSRLGLTSGGTGSDDMAYYGVSGGIRAFSIASTSCNIGNQTAQWIDSHSGSTAGKHPVIGQNAYRYLDGQFEQIGMSWLKHSFCAVSEPTCGSCQSTGCSSLGIGCADTYWATLNGSSLGPRSQINPWPPVGIATHVTNPTGPSGVATIAGRLQITDADINAGGINVVEIQYITHDEPFPNRYNNSSWRPVNINLSSMTGMAMNGFPASGQASVRWQEAAIYAWQEIDPEVQIVPVDVPNNGRMLLGYKVTDNGDGTWSYEYAIQNLNNDRGLGAVTIPMSPGTQVLSMGFHDVDHHSGEPYSTADWTMQEGADSLTWSTQTYGQNINANALRWGSLFNYRFTANVAPAEGSLDMAIFKPGDPETMAVDAVLVPGPVVGTCDGDTNGDNVVDVLDLVIVISDWGTNGPNGGDVDDSGVVDVSDLVVVISAWGSCP